MNLMDRPRFRKSRLHRRLARNSRFRWSSLPGLHYTLQVTSDLAHPTGKQYQDVVGDGSTRGYSEPIAPNSQRFYRVIAQ